MSTIRSSRFPRIATLIRSVMLSNDSRCTVGIRSRAAATMAASGSSTSAAPSVPPADSPVVLREFARRLRRDRRRLLGHALHGSALGWPVAGQRLRGDQRLVEVPGRQLRSDNATLLEESSDGLIHLRPRQERGKEIRRNPIDGVVSGLADRRVGIRGEQHEQRQLFVSPRRQRTLGSEQADIRRDVATEEEIEERGVLERVHGRASIYWRPRRDL